MERDTEAQDDQIPSKGYYKKHKNIIRGELIKNPI